MTRVLICGPRAGLSRSPVPALLAFLGIGPKPGHQSGPSGGAIHGPGQRAVAIRWVVRQRTADLGHDDHRLTLCASLHM